MKLLSFSNWFDVQINHQCQTKFAIVPHRWQLLCNDPWPPHAPHQLHCGPWQPSCDRGRWQHFRRRLPTIPHSLHPSRRFNRETLHLVSDGRARKWKIWHLWTKAEQFNVVTQHHGGWPGQSEEVIWAESIGAGNSQEEREGWFADTQRITSLQRRKVSAVGGWH